MNEIIFDEIKINRTYKYLLPCLYDNKTEYKKRLKSLFKYQIGLFDYANMVNNGEVTYSKCVAILFDSSKYFSVVSNSKKKVIRNSFYIKSTMKFFRKADNYVKDYSFHDPRNNDLHILVLKIPEKYYTAYSKFIKSEYSRMYTSKQMEMFTLDDRVVKILKKDQTIFKEISNSFESEFGTSIDHIDDLKEFDFPLTYDLRREIINFDESLVKKAKASERLYLYNDILKTLENAEK